LQLAALRAFPLLHDGGTARQPIGAWDNAAEFPASIPTFAHYLRLAGYRTCLSGKMHFVGPDQLHGFEERVTTDMYPSDFGWTPGMGSALRRSSGGFTTC
jgi:arylsulfatase A-like enzyme